MPVQVFHRLRYLPESKNFEFVFKYEKSEGTYIVSRSQVKEWIAVLRRSTKECVLNLPTGSTTMGSLRIEASVAARCRLAEYFELVLEAPE